MASNPVFLKALCSRSRRSVRKWTRRGLGRRE